MEEKSLPPVTPISSEDESNSLDTADTNAPVSSFSLSQKTYPIETLEVRSEGDAPVPSNVISSTAHTTAFSRRRAMIVSLSITLLVVLLTGLAVAYIVRENTTENLLLRRDIPTQGVKISEPLSNTGAIGLQGEEDALLVNGDIVSSGTIKVTDAAFVSVIETEVLSADQTFRLPNASGTLCLDANNCNFATQAEQTALQAQVALLGAQLSQINIPEVTYNGVNELNGQNGSLVIQGTTNRVSIITDNGTIRITTPQDLSLASSPTFAGLLLTGGLSVGGTVTLPLNCTTYASGGTLTTNSGGQIVCADDDVVGVTTPGGAIGTIPLFTGSQVIGNSILTQSGATVNVGGSLSLMNALGVAYGGTGIATTPTNGQLLIGNGSGYNLAALTQGSGITISNGSGSITIASTLGNTVAGSEIEDGTITYIDLGTSNGPVSNQVLTYTNDGLAWQDAGSLIGLKVDSLNALTGDITFQGTAGEITVTDNGSDTLTLSLQSNVSLLGQTIGNSELENDAVQLGTQTSGQYIANLGAPVGLSLTGNSGEGSTPVLSVLYGSSANTAVQGNTTLQCANGLGNLSGGGNIVTLGAGGSCNTIQTVNNPTFSVSVGTPELVLIGGGNNGSLVVSGLGQATTYTLSDPGQATADICLSTGNCSGVSGAYAPSTVPYLLTGSFGSTYLSNERSLQAGSNLTAVDGGPNGNYTIATINNPTFDTSVTTPVLQSSGALGLTSSGAGNDITLTSVDQIILNAGSTIQLQDSTDISGNLDITGLTSAGNTASAISRHIFSVSHTFDASNACNLGLCSGVDSVVTLGSTAPSPGSVAALSGVVYAGGGATIPLAYGVLVNTGGGAGTIQQNHGIYIANQTAGTTANYGLRIAGASTYALSVDSGASRFNGTLTVTGQATFGTTSSAGTLSVYDGSSNTGTIQTASLANDRTYTLPDADGTICLTSGNCIGGGSGAAPANASFLLMGADANLTSERIITMGNNLSATDGGANGNYTINIISNPTFATWVRTPSLLSAGALSIASQGAGNDVTVTSADQIILNSTGATFQSTADSTTALRVMDVDGGDPVFSVDTVNEWVGIGTTAPANKLNLNTLTTADSAAQLAVATAGSSNKGILVQGVSGQTADLFQAQDSTGAILASISAAGELTVMSATINGTLTVNGYMTINGHIVSGNLSGSTATVAGTAADCSTTGSTTIDGTDIAGTVTINTGTGVCTPGTLATVTFADTYGASPRVILTPKDVTGAALDYYNGSTATTTFTIDTGTAAAASTTYTYNYQIIQ